MQREDIHILTRLIVDHILRRGVCPEFSEDSIINDIYRIMAEKWKGRHINDIPYHALPVVCPLDWTEYEERLWRDWIEQNFPYESWEDEVLYPLFGTSSEPWEESVPGWRDELHQFLWTWIRRSSEIVRIFDPMPELEDITEESQDHVKLRIDPYILEHGSAKQKRAALKGLMAEMSGNNYIDEAERV